MSSSKRSFRSVNGMRTLACLLVIAYHLNQHRSIENLSETAWGVYQFIEATTVVVPFFFLLSGTMHSMTFWNAIFEKKPFPNMKKYAIERFFRIAPAFYLALILSFIVERVFYFGSSWEFATTSTSALTSLTSFLSGFFFVSGWHPATFFPALWNGPLWFMSFEVFGYVLVPIFMYAYAKVRSVFWPIVFVGFLVFLLLGHVFFQMLPFPPGEWVVYDWFPYYNIFSFGLYFLIGTLIGYGHERAIVRNMKPSYLFDGITLISLVVLVKFLWYIRDMADFAYTVFHLPYHFPIAGILIAIMIFAIPHSKVIARVLDNWFTAWMAKLSFSLYLFHGLVVHVLIHFVFGQSNLAVIHWGMLVGATLLITLPAAWMVYTYLEVPAIAYARKKFLSV